MHFLRAASMFDQLLAAIEVCHDSGIVHRDLKPSNIMVSHENALDHLTIIDFGLARSARADAETSDKLTETGVVHGTPHYMAPEQCRGEEVSTMADVYSAGILFYEILAGAGPFVGSDAATFMAQHLFVDPPPLHRVAPHVSAGVAAAIHSALAKGPDERPTARELRAALTSAFKGTDPLTLSHAASRERQRISGLSRGERAITGRPKALTSDDARGNVVVWMGNDERSASLRGCLGTAGLTSSLWSGEGPPAVASGGGAQVVFVISSDRMERITDLRSVAPHALVIVVGVRGPEETTASIRAGASDMLLRGAPDSDLAAKVKRLLRRQRSGRAP
jgi:serine/threonine-protein kinase